MRLLRGLLGALLWLVGGLLGLLGVVLCVTILLLPLGIPLLAVARRLLSRAVTLMLPRAMAHPVKEARKGATETGRKARTSVSARTADLGKRARKAARTARKRVA